MPDWNLLAVGSGAIHCHGLPSSEPAAQVFYKEVLPATRTNSYKAQKDTAEVLKAVSLDPSAIGFVDLTAMPKTGQTVKVLAIGPKDKAVAPTPETIRNAMYPISSRLYLYVHPKASDLAKDLAKFLATCGGSEASPYADTVKAVMDTYQKNGLIPLADAALQRMTQDAIKAQAEEKAAKAKNIRK